MAGQAKVYFYVANDTTAFGIALQEYSLVYDRAKNELWSIDVAAGATDTLAGITKTQVNTGGGGSSLWENEDATHIKPKNTKKVNIAHIDPTASAADTPVDTDYFGFWRGAYTWYKVTLANLKTALGLAITAGKTLTVTDNTTLNGGTHSGTNTGDQDLSGLAEDDLNNIDISGLDEETTPDDDDLLVLQKDSDGSIKKVKKSNVGSGGGGGSNVALQVLMRNR